MNRRINKHINHSKRAFAWPNSPWIKTNVNVCKVYEWRKVGLQMGALGNNWLSPNCSGRAIEGRGHHQKPFLHPFQLGHTFLFPSHLFWNLYFIPMDCLRLPFIYRKAPMKRGLSKMKDSAIVLICNAQHEKLLLWQYNICLYMDIGQELWSEKFWKAIIAIHCLSTK